MNIRKVSSAVDMELAKRAARREATKGEPCDHAGYILHGSQNYQYGVDRGPYCPVCDELVEL